MNNEEVRRGSRRGEFSTRARRARSSLRSKVPDGVSHLFPCSAGALFPGANTPRACVTPPRYARRASSLYIVHFPLFIASPSPTSVATAAAHAGCPHRTRGGAAHACRAAHSHRTRNTRCRTAHPGWPAHIAQVAGRTAHRNRAVRRGCRAAHAGCTRSVHTTQMNRAAGAPGATHTPRMGADDIVIRAG